MKFQETAFQQGTFRKCYEMWEKGSRKDKRMVAKVFKDDDVSAQQYFDEAMLQLIASQYAKQFNALNNSRKISFVPVSIYKLLERSNQYVTAEPFIEGKYVKHNDNDGHVDTTDPLPQAFSHFTWEASGRKLLICDIQGVGDVYTDPSICSMADNEGDCFGSSDRGPDAIRKFFKTHKCNEACAKCDLGFAPDSGMLARASRHCSEVKEQHNENLSRKKGLSLWTAGKAYGRSLIFALGISSARRDLRRASDNSSPSHSPSPPSQASQKKSPEARLRGDQATKHAASDGSTADRQRARSGSPMFARPGSRMFARSTSSC